MVCMPYIKSTLTTTIITYSYWLRLELPNFNHLITLITSLTWNVPKMQISHLIKNVNLSPLRPSLLWVYWLFGYKLHCLIISSCRWEYTGSYRNNWEPNESIESHHTLMNSNYYTATFKGETNNLPIVQAFPSTVDELTAPRAPALERA